MHRSLDAAGVQREYTYSFFAWSCVNDRLYVNIRLVGIDAVATVNRSPGLSYVPIHDSSQQLLLIGILARNFLATPRWDRHSAWLLLAC